MEQQAVTNQNEEDEANRGYVDKRTPAQLAFDKMQEKRVILSCYMKNHHGPFNDRRVQKQ